MVARRSIVFQGGAQTPEMECDMRSLWNEFREFAFKGNMIDLAVAVVIGGAFGAVVNSLVKHVIMPVLSYVIPTQGGYMAWHIGRIQIGLFLGEIVNFVIIAAAVFVVIVKVMGALMKRAMPPPAAGEPTTKECPFCLSVIPIKARKCGHCTSELTVMPTP
jgi:large conductance mechanosensitive channel